MKDFGFFKSMERFESSISEPGAFSVSTPSPISAQFSRQSPSVLGGFVTGDAPCGGLRFDFSLTAGSRDAASIGFIFFGAPASARLFSQTRIS
jgi:hypothetical protein